MVSEFNWPIYCPSNVGFHLLLFEIFCDINEIEKFRIKFFILSFKIQPYRWTNKLLKRQEKKFHVMKFAQFLQSVYHNHCAIQTVRAVQNSLYEMFFYVSHRHTVHRYNVYHNFPDIFSALSVDCPSLFTFQHIHVLYVWTTSWMIPYAFGGI